PLIIKQLLDDLGEPYFRLHCLGELLRSTHDSLFAHHEEIIRGGLKLANDQNEGLFIRESVIHVMFASMPYCKELHELIRTDIGTNRLEPGYREALLHIVAQDPSGIDLDQELTSILRDPVQDPRIRRSAAIVARRSSRVSFELIQTAVRIVGVSQEDGRLKRR